jgi:hypothetical protein
MLKMGLSIGWQVGREGGTTLKEPIPYEAIQPMLSDERTLEAQPLIRLPQQLWMGRSALQSHNSRAFRKRKYLVSEVVLIFVYAKASS